MGVGAYEAARHDARDALHLDPESAYAFVEWRLLAEAEFRLGSFDAALVAAKRSAARNQNYVWAYVCMAAIQGEQGDVDAACMNLDRAYGLVPDLAARFKPTRFGITTSTRFSSMAGALRRLTSYGPRTMGILTKIILSMLNAG